MKITPVVLACVLLLALASCSSYEPQATPEDYLRFGCSVQAQYTDDTRSNLVERRGTVADALEDAEVSAFNASYLLLLAAGLRDAEFEEFTKLGTEVRLAWEPDELVDAATVTVTRCDDEGIEKMDLEPATYVGFACAIADRLAGSDLEHELYTAYERGSLAFLTSAAGEEHSDLHEIARDFTAEDAKVVGDVAAACEEL